MVRVDVTGKRFDRMSMARKSMVQLRSHGNKLTVRPSPPSTQNGDEDRIEVLMDEEGAAVLVDEATGEVQTVRRRSRTRKPRGRRRNTLAGTDQREIEEAAANGFVFLFLSSVVSVFVNPRCLRLLRLSVDFKYHVLGLGWWCAKTESGAAAPRELFENTWCWKRGEE